jgi:hypothetical protein
MPLGSVCRLLYGTAQIGAKPQEENMKPARELNKSRRATVFMEVKVKYRWIE